MYPLIWGPWLVKFIRRSTYGHRLLQFRKGSYQDYHFPVRRPCLLKRVVFLYANTHSKSSSDYRPRLVR